MQQLLREIWEALRLAFWIGADAAQDLQEFVERHLPLVIGIVAVYAFVLLVIAGITVGGALTFFVAGSVNGTGNVTMIGGLWAVVGITIFCLALIPGIAVIRLAIVALRVILFAAGLSAAVVMRPFLAFRQRQTTPRTGGTR